MSQTAEEMRVSLGQRLSRILQTLCSSPRTSHLRFWCSYYIVLSISMLQTNDMQLLLRWPAGAPSAPGLHAADLIHRLATASPLRIYVVNATPGPKRQPLDCYVIAGSVES